MPCDDLRPVPGQARGWPLTIAATRNSPRQPISEAYTKNSATNSMDERRTLLPQVFAAAGSLRARGAPFVGLRDASARPMSIYSVLKNLSRHEVLRPRTGITGQVHYLHAGRYGPLDFKDDNPVRPAMPNHDQRVEVPPSVHAREGDLDLASLQRPMGTGIHDSHTNCDCLFRRLRRRQQRGGKRHYRNQDILRCASHRPPLSGGLPAHRRPA